MPEPEAMTRSPAFRRPARPPAGTRPGALRRALRACPSVSSFLTLAGAALVASFVTLLCGCPAAWFDSAQEQIEFQAHRVCIEPPGSSISADDCLVPSPALADRPWSEGFVNSGPLLEGTVLCLHGQLRIDEVRWSQCFDVEAVGPAMSIEHPNGDCWNLGDASTTWTFTPLEDSPTDDDDSAFGPSCGEGFVELVVDTLTLEVVTAAQIVPQLLAWPEMGAVEFGLELSTGEALPEGLDDPLRLPILLAEGEPVLMNLGLRDPTSGELVAWNPTSGSVELAAVEGDVGALAESLGDDRPPEQAVSFAVTLPPGSASSLRLSLPGADFDLGELRAAPVSDIESLELLVGMTHLDETSEPMAAVAIARDADGDRIHGAPIRWSVRGPALAIESRASGAAGWFDLAGADYLWVTDDCQPPSVRVGTRSSTLVARINGIEASEELTWVVAAPADPESADAGWTRPGICTGRGCAGCSSAVPLLPARSSPLWGGGCSSSRRSCVVGGAGRRIDRAERPGLEGAVRDVGRQELLEGARPPDLALSRGRGR